MLYGYGLDISFRNDYQNVSTQFRPNVCKITYNKSQQIGWHDLCGFKACLD